MKLRLNLSTTPQENNRPFLAGAILLGTVGLLALLILSRAAYTSWQSNRELRADISHWQEEIRANHVKQQDLAQYFQTPAAREVIDRSVFLNSLIDERSFPWTKIFMDLEKTLPPGVRIVSISPHLVNGRAEVGLQVGVMSDESEIQFLEAIEKSPVFSRVEVDQVRHVSQVGVADKILLNLTVWYNT
jgi:Tfp pilus assembly protein PilN